MKKNFDYLLFSTILITILLGIIILYSATYGMEGRGIGSLWKRQLIWMGIGLLTMHFAIIYDYQTLGRYAHIIYGLSVLLLILVLFLGTTLRHTRGWFVFGPLHLQPSELAKFTTLLMLAAYLQDKKDRLNEPVSLVIPLLIVGIPVLLVMKQPDLGTALLFLPPFLVILYLAGVKKGYLIALLSIAALTFTLLLIHSWIESRPETINSLIFSIFKFSKSIDHIITLLSILLLVLALLFYLFKAIGITLPLRHLLGWYLVIAIGLLSSFMIDSSLKDYQRRRLLVFLSPDIDPLGAGYNIIQSKIAIGSGGLFGKGFLSGTQSRLGFLPERQTDFIFSVIAEEWGFIGVSILLLLFLIIISQGFSIADTSRDMFGSLLAAGITTTIASQVLLNIGMATGMLPVVGVPLPLISYGGSSLVMTMTALGVLLNIRLRRFLV